MTDTGIISRVEEFFGHKPQTEKVDGVVYTEAADGELTPVIDPHLEMKITAQTLWAEARGEGIAGMTAVADVIANRVAVARLYVEDHKKHHPLFGNGTFSDCCKRHEQFSCWNANDPNFPKIQGLTISDPEYLEALKIASQAVLGKLIDTTHASTYYKVKGTPAKWAEGKQPAIVIGHQEFYNDIA